MPGLVVDDNISVNTQFSFQNSDLDTSFALSDTLKARLDDILQDARTKISSISYPPEAIPEDIPNDPLYPLSQIKTEDIYIDESLKDILYPGGEELYFPQPSTDDRKDFEINIPESEIIIFKSLSLTFASVEKKELKTILNNIIEDLGLNLNLLMSKSNKTEARQKITLLKNFNKRLDTAKKTDIENQLQSHEWLIQLVEDQLKNETNYSFGENYENRKFKNKFPYITTRQRKKKLLRLTSEDRLKDLPSIYATIPADPHKKIESAKAIFSNIIGRIPPESYTKFKIDFKEPNNINISETKYDSDDGKFTKY